MIQSVLIWVVAVPGALTLSLVALGLRAWRTTPVDDETGRWAAGLAVGVGYVAAQWGLNGSPWSSNDVGQKLIYVVAAGAVVGALEGATRLPTVARAIGRLLISGAASYALLEPLINRDPPLWPKTEAALWFAVVGLATLVLWTALDALAARERGPRLAVWMGLLVVGTSATLGVSSTANAAMLTGVMGTCVGVCFLVALRSPGVGRLRSSAAPVALLLAGQLTIARFYGEMPLGSYWLLVGAAVVLLSAWSISRRARPLPAFLLALTALLLPVGAAFGIGAKHYFAERQGQSDAGSEEAPGTSGTGPDDDYGY